MAIAECGFLNEEIEKIRRCFEQTPGTLPTPWNAGLIEMAWVTVSFAKDEAQQRRRTAVLNVQRSRSKAFFSVPAESHGDFSAALKKDS